jgi:ribokinase
MITVFGSINLDLITRTARLPKPGETVAGRSFSTAAGGKGANQALAARRAGAEVRMAGAVGSDAFAGEALALLKEAGADLSQVAEVDGTTGTASILVAEEGGENVIVVVSGANGTLTAKDAETTVSKMRRGDSLLLQLEVPPAAVETALRAAKADGVWSVLNVAPLTDDAVRLAALADIVIANESEFELLAGNGTLSAASRESEMKRLHESGGQSFIVTLGGEGVVALHEGRFHRAAGLKIDPVDTVGAGDTFCGALAAGLDSGLDFGAALERAAVAGSLACLKPGAQPAIPTADEIEAAMEGRRVATA